MRNSKSLNINNLESLVNFIDGVNKEFRILLWLHRSLQTGYTEVSNPSFLKPGLFQILLLGKKNLCHMHKLFYFSRIIRS